MNLDLEKIILGILIFSLFVVGGLFMVNDINKNYKVSISNNSFVSVYDTIDEVYNITEDMDEKTLSAKIDSEATATWESMVKGVYSAIRSPFKSVGNIMKIFSSILGAISSEFYLPVPFVILGLVAFSFIIIMSVIYLVMKFKG